VRHLQAKWWALLDLRHRLPGRLPRNVLELSGRHSQTSNNASQGGHYGASDNASGKFFRCSRRTLPPAIQAVLTRMRSTFDRRRGMGKLDVIDVGGDLGLDDGGELKRRGGRWRVQA
jgi:hypothetical protein